MTSYLSEPQAILRVLCGIWFLPHVIGKVRHIDRAAQTFAKAGFRPPRAFVVVTVACELAAASGLISGYEARPAAALAVIVLLGAAYAVLRINGWNWRWQRQGPEYMLFWALACLLSVSR